MRTFGQALRNSIEIERAAARFYEKITARATDDDTRIFLVEMARQEEAHAKMLEEMASRVDAGTLPASSDDKIDTVEAAPGWDCSEEGLELRQAITIAIEAENNAALYYDAMADFAQGEVAEFFHKLSETELEHAKILREKLDQLK